MYNGCDLRIFLGTCAKKCTFWHHSECYRRYLMICNLNRLNVCLWNFLAVNFDATQIWIGATFEYLFNQSKNSLTIRLARTQSVNELY